MATTRKLERYRFVPVWDPVADQSRPPLSPNRDTSWVRRTTRVAATRSDSSNCIGRSNIISGIRPDINRTCNPKQAGAISTVIECTKSRPHRDGRTT